LHRAENLAKDRRDKISRLPNERVISFTDNSQPHTVQQNFNCYKISVGKHLIVSLTVRIWHLQIFTCFLPWKSIYQDIVPPAVEIWTCFHPVADERWM